MPKPKHRPDTPNPAVERRRQLQKLRPKLDAARTTLSRWMSRLKRAFHAVEKIQARIAHLERQIARATNA
jgi:hypothetical protein